MESVPGSATPCVQRVSDSACLFYFGNRQIWNSPLGLIYLILPPLIVYAVNQPISVWAYSRREGTSMAR